MICKQWPQSNVLGRVLDREVIQDDVDDNTCYMPCTRLRVLPYHRSLRVGPCMYAVGSCTMFGDAYIYVCGLRCVPSYKPGQHV